MTIPLWKGVGPHRTAQLWKAPQLTWRKAVSAGVCDHEYEQVWQRPVKCDESCMSALQIKIFIVFTGKTYGMKLLEYGKPMLKRCQCSKGEEEADPEDVFFSKFSRLEPAQGTFSDFSQMVIQFGYVTYLTRI